jgi:hypothetical protein
MAWVTENNKIEELGLIPISEAEALAILNPPPTKEQRIETAVVALDAERDAKLAALKVEYNGANYDADEKSRALITSAAMLLSLAPAGTTQEWIGADNIVRNLTLQDLAAIGSLIGQEVTRLTIEYRLKKDAAIEAIEAGND